MLNPSLTPEENIRIIYDDPYWSSPFVDVPAIPSLNWGISEISREELTELVAKYNDTNYKYRRFAGERLCKSLKFLSPEELCEVGMTLLRGRRHDCRWMCTVLVKDWLDRNGESIRNHPEYAQVVEECWNRYHEEACGDLLIRDLDEEVVKKYWDELCAKGHYLAIYKRFRNESWFKLDTNELKRCMEVNEYLAMMSQIVAGVTEEEARLIMYGWVAMVLNQTSEWCSSPLEVFKRYLVGERQIINISKFEVALYYLLCMKLDKVVEDILQWNDLVKNKTMMKNDEAVFRKTAIENFPKDLKFLLDNDGDKDGWVEYQGKVYALPREFPWCVGREGMPNFYLRTCGFELFENDEETEEEKEEAFYNNLYLRNLMESLDLEYVIPE